MESAVSAEGRVRREAALVGGSDPVLDGVVLCLGGQATVVEVFAARFHTTLDDLLMG
jgi:hypothetical protein